MNLINLLYTPIVESASRLAAYAGAKGGNYEQLATVDGDEPMLRTYWQQSIDHIAFALRSIIASLQSSPETVTFTLTEECAEPMRAHAESALATYCALSIAAQWLQLAGAGEQSGYKAEAAALLESVCRSLMLAPTTRGLEPPF